MSAAYFTDAARAGSRDAMYALAQMFYPKGGNFREQALDLYLDAARLGHDGAREELDRLRRTDPSIPKP